MSLERFKRFFGRVARAARQAKDPALTGPGFQPVGTAKRIPVGAHVRCGAKDGLYRNVHSLIGGYKGLVAAGWPMKSGELDTG